MTIRIFADFNDQDEQGRVLLHIGESLRDIEKHKQSIRPGLPVILYTDDDDGLQVSAVLEYDADHQIWVADWSDSQAATLVQSSSRARKGNEAGPPGR
jgi:hypothetical protein